MGKMGMYFVVDNVEIWGFGVDMGEWDGYNEGETGMHCILLNKNSSRR